MGDGPLTWATITDETPRGISNGRGRPDNSNDARASSYCFLENDQPGLRPLNTKAVLGPRSRKGASARCCFVCPLVGVRGAVLVRRSFFCSRGSLSGDSVGHVSHRFPARVLVMPHL